MNGISVLITGGSGFVGSRIVEHVRNKYPHCLITVLDIHEPTTNPTDESTRFVQADITSLPSVQAALQATRPQAVIHSAAIVPPLSERYRRTNEQLVKAINVEGTRNIVQAAREVGVEAFVFTSSCAAVTDSFEQDFANIDERWPTVDPGHGSVYGESKAQAEAIVCGANTTKDGSQEGVFKTCALRCAVVFGEGDYQVIPTMVNLIPNESPYKLGNGLNMWDTVYVGNVADAHVLALENLLSDKHTAAGEVFFIQNNEPVSMRDFMLFVWREFNGHVPAFEVSIPVRLGWAVGAVAEIYTWITGTPTTLSRGSVLDATMTRYASGEKARSLLGYEPRVGLEKGLRLSIREYATRLSKEPKRKSDLKGT